MAEVYTTNQLTDSSHYMYDDEYHVGEYHVKYIDCQEQGQGGPSIGGLMVNGVLINNHLFSGPPLLSAENILVPEYEWLGGFRIARIHLPTLTVKIFGKRESLILLQEVRDGEVFYVNDIRKLNWIPGDDNRDKQVTLE